MNGAQVGMDVTVKAEKVGQVSEAISRLNDLVNTLEVNISRLIDNIQPILNDNKSTEGCPESGEEKRVSVCTVAYNIQEVSDRLAAISRLVERTTAEVEI